jgi:hypothetical protein
MSFETGNGENVQITILICVNQGTRYKLRTRLYTFLIGQFDFFPSGRFDFRTSTRRHLLTRREERARRKLKVKIPNYQHLAVCVCVSGRGDIEDGFVTV